MKYLKEEKKTIVLATFAIGLMLILNIQIFRNYRETLLNQQSSHMITTAKAVANNLKNYYDETLDHFSLYFKMGVTKNRLMDYSEEQREVSGSYLVDLNGQVILENGIDHADVLPDVIRSYLEKQTSEARLISPILTGERHYTQFIVQRVLFQEEVQFVVISIEMETVYQRIVEPIQIGSYGYSMVKNFDGTILMHKSSDQIGINAVEGRRAQYSEYDLELDDLELWVQEQRDHQEGSRILESYWWEENKDPVKTKKVVAYTQVAIGDETWILNGTLDYNELQEPLRTTQRYLFLLNAGIVLLFGVFLLFVADSANRSQTMEREMKHLLEMNEAWEELHKREEQIRHNDKMQTLGTMTSMIAHEFNNFLTPIMLYGELLSADSALDETGQSYAREIVEAAEKSKDLTKELSRYGRIEKGSKKKVTVLVQEEIQKSLSMIEKTLPPHIRLEQQLEPVLTHGLVSPSGMINQVIMNLCTNAVHAMRVSGGVLTIKGRVIKREMTYYYGITVQDTGEGIPEEARTRIFTPFYTTKEVGTGTGLGLSVVQDLIHQVSGEIQVISSRETGTRFDILLPLSEIKEKTIPSETTESLEDKQIYILDDDERVGKALERSLRKVCMKTKYSSHPEKALAEIRGSMNEWNVIVTDYAMPMMDGLAFAGILRSLGYNGKIILTSGCLDHHPDWYLENGIVDAVLEKPVSRQQIEACMKS